MKTMAVGIFKNLRAAGHPVAGLKEEEPGRGVKRAGVITGRDRLREAA